MPLHVEIPPAVLALNTEHQHIYQLRYRADLTIQQIMDRLNMKHHTVRYRLECIHLAICRARLKR